MMAVALGALSACASPLPSPAPTQPHPTARPPAAPPPVPQPRPSEPTADLRPEQLTGLTHDQARDLLGQPSAQSTQAMATVWDYRMGGCTLKLMFYPEVETAVERVLSYEVEGSGSAATCLRRLREERLRHAR